MREYTPRDEFIANLPYTLMTIMGAALIVSLPLASAWLWPAGLAYVFYGIAGALWIMCFLCPACAFHGTRSCPCGYGRIAARLRPEKKANCFEKKFKAHISVIVPLWFIPPLAAGWGLYREFAWWRAVLLGLFVIISFVVLPLTSTKHSCAQCPQRDQCPWMRGKKGASEPK